jgi:DNA-binding NarL/FixJ family response regulator
MALPIRVYVVDDHEVVRAGLKALLERSAEFIVCGMAPSAERAFAQIDVLNPDVVVLDHRLPEMSGVLACREIQRRWPEVRVMMLTSTDMDDVVFACLAAGATGYLLKQAATQSVIEAVRAVARGETVLAPEVVERIVDWVRRAQVPGGDGFLNPQEVVALSLFAQGRTNREVARSLGVSEGTVKGYLRHLKQKLGAHDRSEAVAAGIRRGVI